MTGEPQREPATEAGRAFVEWIDQFAQVWVGAAAGAVPSAADIAFTIVEIEAEARAAERAEADRLRVALLDALEVPHSGMTSTYDRRALTRCDCAEHRHLAELAR